LLSGSLLAWLAVYRIDALAGFERQMDARLSAIVYRRTPEPTVLRDVLSFSGLALLVFGFARIGRDSAFPGFWAVLPVAGALLLISAGPHAWINRKVLSNPVAVWFGLISYPLYLWHWPLLSFARIVESGAPGRSIRMAVVLLSVVLAWLTYAVVERRLRSASNAKAKVAALVVLMIIVGLFGYDITLRNGYPTRPAIALFLDNRNELVRLPATDDACVHYLNGTPPLFAYCRFSDVGASKTVAVVGDSHAHVAYPGIADYLKGKGVNTVLLANSGCPPLIGSPIGKTDADKQSCDDRINQIIDVLVSKKDIDKIFFFTRGEVYLTGTQPANGDTDLLNGVRISLEDYASGTVRTINRLTAAEKKVFYVTENPELPFHPVGCLSRPLRMSPINCSLDVSVVLARQRRYLDVVKTLSNVTIVDSLSVFCPTIKCRVFDDDGLLLYADDNHLSAVGSRFLVKNRLIDLLD
jgi:hypothetical protein